MCRDFIRARHFIFFIIILIIKFSHKCDTSQLDGIFTFCRNFQKTRRSLKRAALLHFYRTGELPPHALAHHNQVNILPPSQPPPPPPEGRLVVYFFFITLTRKCIFFEYSSKLTGRLRCSLCSHVRFFVY